MAHAETDSPQFSTTKLTSSFLPLSTAIYGELLAQEIGQAAIEPVKFISPILARFMSGDRASRKQDMPGTNVRSHPKIQRHPGWCRRNLYWN